MSDGFYDLYVEEVEKNEKANKKIAYLSAELLSFKNHSHYLEATMESSISKVSEMYEAKIEQLTNKFGDKIHHLEGLLNIDSDNSGIPTSMTPLNKQKRIPNTRKKTENKIGGQPSAVWLHLRRWMTRPVISTST